MKQSISVIFVLLLALSAKGQIPQWTIKPQCDTIYVKDTNILQGENQSDNILWSMDGNMLFATTKNINPFSNGVATIQNRNSLVLEGFVDSKGVLTELPNVKAAHGYPYFEDGYFVAQRGDEYLMYNKSGKTVELPVLEILYPYSDELATYYAYQNPEKKKNPFFNLLLSDGNPVKNFVIKEKDKEKTKLIEPKDVSFMSSVDPNTGRALAIVKNKLYWFDKFEMCLLPIIMEDGKDKKRQLELESNKALSQLNFPIDSLTIVAKTGKDQTMEFRFDKMLRLLPKYVSASSSNNAIKRFQVPSYPTDIKVTSEGNKYGLEYQTQFSIPAQFENVGLTYGNKAVVRTDGHWGVIEFNPNLNYTLQLNGGNELQISHNKTKSTVQIGLPAKISPTQVKVETPNPNSLRLDNSSRTQQENTISYTTILGVPAALTDTISEVSFGPLSLIVDGIRLADRMVKAKGKFENPYGIFFADPNAEAASGKAVFDVMVRDNIEAGLLAAPFEVTIESDSLPVMIEKISDNLYRCTVDNLESGINDVTVKVTEKDCPSCSFPIKINYTKAGKKETATLRNQALEDLLNTPKGVVFDDGYMVGEIVSDNPPQHKGPGYNFPKSTEYDESMGRTEIWSPYKGYRIKVKEEDDWYLLAEDMTHFDPSKRDRRYIPKRYIKPVESTPFVKDDGARVALYYRISEEVDEDEETYYNPEVVAIYPNGLFVVYSQGLYDLAYYFGNYKDGDPALISKYRFSGSCINDKNTGTVPIVTVGRAPEGTGIYIDYPKNKYLTTTFKKQKVEYPDLSLINEEKWLDILEKAKKNEFFNEYNVNILVPENELIIFTKDELEKEYTKVK